MANLAITVSAFLLFLHSNVNADNSPGGRLQNILKSTPMVHRLEKYGYPPAVFSTYKDIDMSSSTFGMELCALEIPKASGTLRVKDLRSEGESHSTFKAETPKMSLGSVSGGFFGVNGHGKMAPLGLVKAEGKIFSRINKWKSGGVIVGLKNDVKIIPISEFSDKDSYINALQSKPLLIEQEKNGIHSVVDDRFDRSAIAVDANDSIYFFVLHEPVGSTANLSEFSQLIQFFRPANGSKIQFALAMDGGPGAQMYIPALKKHCGASVNSFIPNMVYIEK